MAYDSITRVGEVKFQKFSDWNFDYRTNLLYINWHEPKTIETYAMPCIPDNRWWFDFYFMLGAYAIFSNGLLRDDEQMKLGLEYTVFTSLHKVSHTYVAKMTSKSIRKGLISQMSN